MDYCILSAGIGSRFKPFSNFANKALAPIPYQALISNIINSIPLNSRIYIATGYLFEDLEEIIKDIHSDRKIIFKRNLEYSSTEMGDTLMGFIDELSDEFVILPNDGIYPDGLNIENEKLKSDILLGTSTNEYDPNDYTNLLINQNQEIMKIQRGKFSFGEDKNKFISKIFTGFMFVKNKNTYKTFLSNYPKGKREIYFPIKDYLENKKLVQEKEFNWVDCGTYQKYKNELNKLIDYDFSKSNETLLIYKNKRVYKIFADEKISKKRVQKANIYKDALPKCNLLPSYKGYSYAYEEGQTLYEDPKIENLINLLEFLSRNLWSKKSLNENLQEDAEEFYKNKTLKRLELLEKKYPLNKIKNINNQEINYVSIIPPFDYDFMINNIHISPFHGDLQYDNVLVKKDKSFVLIDWRHEFGKCVEFGDIYYDLAKLLGGVILNYKRIKNGDFKACINQNYSNIDYVYVEDSYSLEHQKIIYDYHYKNNLDINHTRKLLSLIYFNMAPLHESPFDLLLIALANKIFWANA